MSYEAATEFIMKASQDIELRTELGKIIQVHDLDDLPAEVVAQITHKGRKIGYEFTPAEIQEAYSAWTDERDLDEDDLDMVSGGAGRCYIATATLKLQGSEAPLTALRAWRDAVLTRSETGRRLEAYYDKTGPVVAARASESHLLAASFLYLLVLPSVFLARQRQAHPVIAPVCDTLIYGLFLVGLAYGTVCYHLLRK